MAPVRLLPLYLLTALSVGALTASAPTAAAQAPTVTVTTTYEYHPQTLLPTVVTVTPSDGLPRRTETVYAHQGNDDMRARNMLTQVHRTTVRQAAGGAALACAKTDWASRALSAGTAWLPHATYEGCGADEFHTAYFGYDDSYDGRGRLVHMSDGAGLEMRAYYGTNADPFAAGPSNMRVTAVRQFGAYVMGWRWTEDDARSLTQTFRYNARGLVERTTDANGRHRWFEYDGLGRLTAVRDHGGGTAPGDVVESYAYGYAGGGLPNRVQTTRHAPVVQRSTEVFDGRGRPEMTVVHAAGSPTASGIGTAVLAEYDAAGRPWRSWRPVNVQTLDGVPVPGAHPTRAEAVRAAARTAYANAEGNGAGGLNQPFAETAYEASPLGRPTFAREPGAAGHGAAMRYGVGRADEAFPGVRPEGAAPPMWYAESEDADGRRTRVYTDGLGQARFVRAGIGHAQEETLTETLYDAAGRLVATRPPTYFRPRTRVSGPAEPSRAGATTYAYDTRGQLLQATSPDGGTARMLYDGAGRVVRRQDAYQASAPTVQGYGQASAYTYDALGRMTTETVGELYCSFTQIDRQTRACPGRQTAFIGEDVPWNHGEQIRRSHYDDVGLNSWSDSTEPGFVLGWPWFTSATFPFANTRGRLAAEAYFSDGKWQSVAYAYDNEGRVAHRWVNTQGATHPEERFSYAYDRIGQLTSLDVTVGPHRHRRTFSHNARGEVTSSTAGAGAAGSTISTPVAQQTLYTADGSVQRTTYPGVNLLTGTHFTDRTYDVQGRLRRIGDLNRSANTRFTDPAAQPASPSTGIAYEHAFASGYHYSPGGMITQADYRTPYAVIGSPYTDVPGVQAFRWRFEYRYDALGRLTDAQYGPHGGALVAAYREEVPQSGWSGGWGPGKGYDANGNVLSLVRWSPSGQTLGSSVKEDWVDHLTYTYTQGTNRLASVADQANWPQWAGTSWDAKPSMFYYHGDGLAYYEVRRPVNASNQLYSLARLITRRDEAGRPLQEQLPVTGATRYAYSRYGVDGMRIGRQVQGGSHLRYVRDGGAVVGVLTGDGALVSWELPQGAGRIEPNGAGFRRLFYWRDHIGTVRGVVRENGSVAESRDYYSWGLEMPGRVYVSGAPTREGFTGHDLDRETGMHYAGARYYQAALTRWTGVDPLEDLYPSHSPYNYVLNNPVSLTDPTGTCPEDGSAGPNQFGPGNCMAAATVTARRIREIPQWIHTTLDLAGSVPVLGIPADLTNAGLYLYTGDHLNAGISIGSTVFDGLGAARAGAVVATGAAGLAMAASRRGVAISRKVSRQRQARHLPNNPDGQSFVGSMEDAQRILDDFHSGGAEVLGVTKNNHIVIRSNAATGTNVNTLAGYPNQPTNVFLIKGSSSPSIVPTTPAWRP